EATSFWSATRNHAALISTRDTRRVPGAVGKSFCVYPIVAALHLCRSPTAVNVRPLACLRVRSGARVICLRRSACAIWSIGKGATRVSACARVIASAKAGAAVWSINSAGSSVDACVRVVPGAVAVRAPVRVIDRVITAVPVIWRVVPAGAPHGATPTDHQTGVTGISGVGHPVVILILVWLYGDVGDAVRWRARRNLVNLLRDGGGKCPRTLRSVGLEPNALVTHVIS